MGGCFSGQKGFESDNAPVPAPASPKAADAEPTTAPPATENIENQKEEPLVDVSETNGEEVKKDAEAVPEAEAKPVEAAAAAPEEAKVAEAAAAAGDAGSEAKISAAPAAL
uniref:Uncharacterized protein n=1 Tax=Kalanchoe fedtschenkoi TaxID=63787 RepID=A0A7N0TBJ0_KALFE